jgi:hypothetical protein
VTECSDATKQAVAKCLNLHGLQQFCESTEGCTWCGVRNVVCGNANVEVSCLPTYQATGDCIWTDFDQRVGCTWSFSSENQCPKDSSDDWESIQIVLLIIALGCVATFGIVVCACNSKAKQRQQHSGFASLMGGNVDDDDWSAM